MSKFDGLKNTVKSYVDTNRSLRGSHSTYLGLIVLDLAKENQGIVAGTLEVPRRLDSDDMNFITAFLLRPREQKQLWIPGGGSGYSPLQPIFASEYPDDLRESWRRVQDELRNPMGVTHGQSESLYGEAVAMLKGIGAIALTPNDIELLATHPTSPVS